MTDTEKRALIVSKAKSREKKNKYTQGAKRDQVGAGWSDCSSFVRWCYKQICGIDIGGNTVAQITNAKLTVADSSGGKYPSQSKLSPGDLIYYKGTDASRPYKVGHVEMYIGGGKIIGHGSGIGPTVKSLTSYSTSRYNNGRGYLRALRVIGSKAVPSTTEKLGERALIEGMYHSEMVRQLQQLLIELNYSCGKSGADGDYGADTAAAVKLFQQAVGLGSTGMADVITIQAVIAQTTGKQPQLKQCVRITGGTVNVRRGSGAHYKALGTVKFGTQLIASGAAADGWIGVIFKDKPAYVSAKYAEVIP